MFVKPVDGDEDLFAYRYDFTPEAKAVEDGKAQLVTEDDDGNLIVEGYAAVWDGIDREGENFAPGAFAAGIKAFLAGSAPLCYHHQHSKVLGKFVDLKEDDKGLSFKARVDGAIRSHPELKTYYEQIKNGTIRGMSVGGFFKRASDKIVGVDITEISATPVPVHPGTTLNVMGAKALEDIKVPRVPKVDGEVRKEDEDMIEMMISELDRVFERIKKRGSGQPKKRSGDSELL